MQQEPLSWSSYKDIQAWNNSFQGQPIINAPKIQEQDVHYIYGLFCNMLCDREISKMTHVHEQIIYRMRIMTVYETIARQYRYPIVFTIELMVQRIIDMVQHDGYIPEMIVEQTGANLNQVVKIYHDLQHTYTHTP